MSRGLSSFPSARSAIGALRLIAHLIFDRRAKRPLPIDPRLWKSSATRFSFAEQARRSVLQIRARRAVLRQAVCIKYISY